MQFEAETLQRTLEKELDSKLHMKETMECDAAKIRCV